MTIAPSIRDSQCAKLWCVAAGGWQGPFAWNCLAISVVPVREKILTEKGSSSLVTQRSGGYDTLLPIRLINFETATVKPPVFKMLENKVFPAHENHMISHVPWACAKSSLPSHTISVKVLTTVTAFHYHDNLLQP